MRTSSLKNQGCLTKLGSQVLLCYVLQVTHLQSRLILDFQDWNLIRYKTVKERQLETNFCNILCHPTMTKLVYKYLAPAMDPAVLAARIACMWLMLEAAAPKPVCSPPAVWESKRRRCWRQRLWYDVFPHAHCIITPHCSTHPMLGSSQRA